MARNFSYSQSPKYRHILVFDTSALLSADKNNRVQVWRNNEQLGECYVPGATYAEISTLSSNSKKPKEQVKAKEFLKFVGDGCRYVIQSTEENLSIPLDNEKDRQIIACAHRLANENPEAVIILVTYELTLKGLVQQSKLPNFCTLEASKLATWFHEDYKRDTVPQEVFDTYNKMKFQKPLDVSRSNNRRLSGGGDVPRKLSSGTDNKPPRKVIPSISGGMKNAEPPQDTPTIRESYKLTPSSSSYRNNPQTSERNNNPSNFLKNPFVIVAMVVVFALFFLFFTKREQPPSPIPSVKSSGSDPLVADYSSVQPTPPNLIAQAQSAVYEFQQSKNPSSLTIPLNLLQTLKNSQGGKLDNPGEQVLSKLKHKYAIEVLATSGQLTEAASLLRQIPQSYSEIEFVRDWLVKQNR
jgi:hypothetical protein